MDHQDPEENLLAAAIGIDGYVSDDSGDRSSARVRIPDVDGV
jgi:hypothetical protein